MLEHTKRTIAICQMIGEGQRSKNTKTGEQIVRRAAKILELSSAETVAILDYLDYPIDIKEITNA